MKLFGRKKDGAIKFSRQIMRQYETRPVVDDSRVLDLIVESMLSVSDIRPVEFLLDEAFTALGVPIEDISFSQFDAIVMNSTRQAGWDQGQALGALGRLQEVRARPDFPELKDLQLTTEHWSQTQIQIREIADKHFIVSELPGSSDKERDHYARQLRIIVREAEYAQVRQIMAANMFGQSYPHLWQYLVDKMEAPREPPKPFKDTSTEWLGSRRWR